MEWLEGLNPSQRAAVEYSEGPELVIAGAGSGKTRVLTYKIAYLLYQGVPANRILALTFTNKAAREMKERITRLLAQHGKPDDARYLWMGTFHSICSRILRQEADRLGYTRDFTIYDTQDQRSVLRQIIKELGLDEKIYKPNSVQARISAVKNAYVRQDSLQWAQWEKECQQERLYDMTKIYRQYQLRLQAANAMDFDDLLVKLCELFEREPDVLAYYQEIFRYVLVDEYQDTNYVQYLLVKQLAAPQNNICVVGDDAQSIYSFRGADIRNILGFQQHYSSARLFKLEQNYRSTQTIVKAANSLIHHNQNQIYKEVFSEKPAGDRIDLTGYMSDRDEALGVAKEIAMESRRSKEKTYEDVAVLYRTNAQSRPIENELRKLGIPYRIYGGTSFYQRKEVKDAIAYFRLAINPKDNEALMRVINYPARGIGETTLRKISEHAILSQLSMLEVVQAPEETGLNVNAGTMKKLVGFGQMVTRFAEAADKMNAYDFAEMIMRESGVRTAAMLDRTPEGIDRAENLEELLNGIHELVDRRTEEGVDFTPIHDFMAEVALLTDQDQNLKDETRRVTLMTVHAAKGLEFPIVYIVGMEENLFPSQMCVRPAEIEEERRLLYVAITRAMERCHMSYARQRFRNGQTQFSSPSRFLNEIDYQFLSRHEGQTAMPQYGRAGGTPMWRTSDMWADRPQRPASPPPPPMPSVSTARMTKAAPAPKAVTTTTTATDDATWPAGTRIRHTVFGEGTVQRTYLDEMTGNEKIEIRFDRVGTKTLLLSFAKLERI